MVWQQGERGRKKNGEILMLDVALCNFRGWHLTYELGGPHHHRRSRGDAQVLSRPKVDDLDDSRLPVFEHHILRLQQKLNRGT